MIVVSDTSPISALLIIDKLALLPQLYTEVLIPQTVLEELLVLQRFGYNTNVLQDYDWLRVANPLDKSLEQKLREELDA